MQIKTKLKVIEKISKAWQMNGRNGITNRVRVLIDGENIFSIKFTDEKMNVFNALPAKGDAEVVITISAPKEEPKIEITEVVKA